MADEPYYLLEEEGYEFASPPSLEDYRALLAFSVRSLTSPSPPQVVFDRTPLDYLAYMTVLGADEPDSVALGRLSRAWTCWSSRRSRRKRNRFCPRRMPALRSDMNDALLELVHADPLDAWEDVPVLELDGPLDGRLGAVLAALDHHA